MKNPMCRFGLIAAFGLWLSILTSVSAARPAARTGNDAGDPFQWPAASTAPAVSLAHPAGRGVPQPDVGTAAAEHAVRQLRLMGIIRSGKRAIALLSAGGASFPVHAGQPIGASGGVVSAIGDSSVRIRWPYQDADGQWRAVDQTLTLQEFAP